MSLSESSQSVPRFGSMFSQESEIPSPLGLFDFVYKATDSTETGAGGRSGFQLSTNRFSPFHSVIHSWAGWVPQPGLLTPRSQWSNQHQPTQASFSSPFFFPRRLTQTCPGQARWESPCFSGWTGCGMRVGGSSGNPVWARQRWVAGSAFVGRNTWRLMAGGQALWKTWPLHSGALRRQNTNIKQTNKKKDKEFWKTAAESKQY